MGRPARYVVGDGLLAGAYPGMPQRSRLWKREGVTVFVDLTHPSDPLDGYGAPAVRRAAGVPSDPATWERRRAAT